MNNKTHSGFTIVELLVVIVVIGILASITIVSYSGISQKATVASLQSDLSNARKQIMLYQVAYGSYPTTLDANKCPSTPTADTTRCLKSSASSNYTHYTSNGTTFSLTEASTNGIKYVITENLSPQVSTALSPTDWLTIGTQTWAKANLNDGTMITGVTAQTNNAAKDRYCYGDSLANCTTYGGLYQWDEAMQYSTAEGAQGLCPAGSHIPSDNDWKILEMQLGMLQAQADATGFRGTDQGTQLKTSGSSGLNIQLAGYRSPAGSFFDSLANGYLWVSSESSPNAWSRYLASEGTVGRSQNNKSNGFSVRCLGN